MRAHHLAVLLGLGGAGVARADLAPPPGPAERLLESPLAVAALVAVSLVALLGLGLVLRRRGRGLSEES